MKNINFGLARGLTRTAYDGQKAVKESLRSTFTIRNRWPDIGPFAIKVAIATPKNLKAEVFTNADWLVAHEEGVNRTPHSGRNIAVPTDEVRRNKRLIIPRGQRPKGLGAKAFVLQTKKGPVLAQRISRGKRKGIIVLYGLEQKVKIRRRSTFYEPLEKVLASRGARHINESIREALASIK